jgi:hypothetical protein
MRPPRIASDPVQTTLASAVVNLRTAIFAGRIPDALRSASFSMARTSLAHLYEHSKDSDFQGQQFLAASVLRVTQTHC